MSGRCLLILVCWQQSVCICMCWYLYTLESDTSRLYTIKKHGYEGSSTITGFFACNYLNILSSNSCCLQRLTIAMAKPGLMGSFLSRFHRDFVWLWRPDADLLGCQHVTCWHGQWEEGVEMGSWWPLIAGFLGEDMIIEEGSGCVFWPEYGFDSRYLCLFGGPGLECGPLLKNSLWIDPSLAGPSMARLRGSNHIPTNWNNWKIFAMNEGMLPSLKNGGWFRGIFLFEANGLFSGVFALSFREGNRVTNSDIW